MTLTQVAQKDFEDAVRSRMVWGVISVFVAFIGFVLLVAIGTSDSADASADLALGMIALFSQLFVPMVAVIVGYMSIVGERRSGSLRVLLSYPHSRRDVVFGKLVGRAGVITLALGVGSGLSMLIAGLVIELPEIGSVIGVLTSITLFGVGFTGLAVGISAGVRTRAKAMAVAIGALLGFLLVWDAAAAGVYLVATGSLPGLEAEAWYFLLKRLSPVNAYRAVAQGFVDGRLQSFFQLGIEDVPADTTQDQLALSNRVDGELPFYLSNWFAALTLTVWAVVPSVVGYVRFERSDL
ncbi:ABC-2 type transport system permease protein [Halobiforma haloterrestris]|uniref:ABC-2 type transport system permease protein n=1 Tax=Natronobacterium haloterrestre TaxID=148448 RepID=A0A1I1K2M2_NATHA|nr:ABC transporter permease subunit [Halobiforma haloterrestris]SFC51860.1 ABC-2 type transport system permease protein [Halobiforma haloterrestris]